MGRHEARLRGDRPWLEAGSEKGMQGAESQGKEGNWARLGRHHARDSNSSVLEGDE